MNQRIQAKPDLLDSGAYDIKKLLILALGGEGGGVLAKWLVEAGLRQNHPVQSTSIPGVAQRTGATSYYIEWMPIDRERLQGREPVFCLAPLPGDLDAIVSSEMLETARAAQRGLTSKERTLVVSSSARVLTVPERAAVADGRLNTDLLSQQVASNAQAFAAFDMSAAAKKAGCPVSAVMFGAVAGSGVLPLDDQVCERVIHDSRRSVEQNIAGFYLGKELTLAARAQAKPTVSTPPAANTEAIGAPADSPIDISKGDLPPKVAQWVDLAMPLLADYQDQAYADAYRARVQRYLEAEKLALGDTDFSVSAHAARNVANWMAYEDIARVADLKIRASRFDSLQQQGAGSADSVVLVRDYLKPGVDEIVAMLPAGLARTLSALARRFNINTLSSGVRVRTTGLSGLLMMRATASLKRFRRASSRFADECALITQWENAMLGALTREPRLALAIAQAPRIMKGYGDTFLRSRTKFVQVFEHAIDQQSAGATTDGMSDVQRAALIKQAISAAQLSPNGRELTDLLGIPPAEPTVQTIQFHPRTRQKS